MRSIFISGAPHRMALELSAKLAPSRVSPDVFEKAARPFVSGLQKVLGDEVENSASVGGMVEARRRQLEGWIASRRAIFRKAGLEVRLEDVDGLVLQCTACFAERVVPAGTMPSLKAMRCPECSAKAG